MNQALLRQRMLLALQLLIASGTMTCSVVFLCPAATEVFTRTWKVKGVTLFDRVGGWECRSGLNYLSGTPSWPAAACSSSWSAGNARGWLASASPVGKVAVPADGSPPPNPATWVTRYPAFSNCEWGIQAPAGSTVKFTVVAFDTEATNDVVKMQRGLTGSAQLVTAASGRRRGLQSSDSIEGDVLVHQGLLTPQDVSGGRVLLQSAAGGISLSGLVNATRAKAIKVPITAAGESGACLHAPGHSKHKPARSALKLQRC
jgi:hypothetical protein